MGAPAEGVKPFHNGARMTDLQKLYADARKERGHYAALRDVARQTGLDPDTITRCLDRARESAAIEARRARRKPTTGRTTR